MVIDHTFVLSLMAGPICVSVAVSRNKIDCGVTVAMKFLLAARAMEWTSSSSWSICNSASCNPVDVLNDLIVLSPDVAKIC